MVKYKGRLLQVARLWGDRDVDTSVSLPAVQPYESSSQAVRQGSRPVWARALSAVLIFGITLVVVGGLFLGGRWAFLAIRDRDDDGDKTATTSTPAQSTTNADSDAKRKADDAKKAEAEKQAAAKQQAEQKKKDEAAAAKAAEQKKQQDAAAAADQAKRDAAKPAATPGQGASQPSAAAPASSTADKQLTSTGPKETIAVFVVTSIVAGLVHYRLRGGKFKRELRFGVSLR